MRIFLFVISQQVYDASTSQYAITYGKAFDVPFRALRSDHSFLYPPMIYSSLLQQISWPLIVLRRWYGVMRFLELHSLHTTVDNVPAKCEIIDINVGELDQQRLVYRFPFRRAVQYRCPRG